MTILPPSESPFIFPPPYPLTPEYTVKVIQTEQTQMNFAFETGDVYDPCFQRADSLTGRGETLRSGLITNSPLEMYRVALDLPPMDQLRGTRVLNLGSGMSYLGRTLALHNISSIDFDPNLGTRITPEGSGRETKGFGEALPFADKAFDEVWALTVLQVVPDPLPILREALRVGKRVRVFPVVSFKNLRDLAIPEGITFLRRGVDYFAVIFEPNVETEKAIAFLKQTDVFCLKPDENTRDRRADGYYYDQEYVLPKEQWYLATSQHLPKD